MKNIFPIFFPFSKLKFKFEHFQKKDDPPSSCSFELTDSGESGQINV